MLSDNSIINFRLDETRNIVCFTYYECPFNCLTYKEYLIENDLDGYYDDKILLDYYEIYLDQCETKENPTMIRYDLDYNSYFSGLHPVSHLHIGHKNHIRFGLRKILHPKAFISFILRQNYPSVWKSLISSENEWIKYFIKEKQTLNDVAEANWQIIDNSEFHLA